MLAGLIITTTILLDRLYHTKQFVLLSTHSATTHLYIENVMHRLRQVHITLISEQTSSSPLSSSAGDLCACGLIINSIERACDADELLGAMSKQLAFVLT